MKIDTTKITEWKPATKTRRICARHIFSLLSDRFLIEKLLLKTLEGNETIKGDSFICVGEAGDVWQQTPEKLLKKYNITGVDEVGWLICNPKPDNEVNCFQITNKFLCSEHPSLILPPDEEMYRAYDFYIIGQWGEKNSFGNNIQWGDDDDFICQSKLDATDVWIVREKIFNNTYAVK